MKRTKINTSNHELNQFWDDLQGKALLGKYGAQCVVLIKYWESRNTSMVEGLIRTGDAWEICAYNTLDRFFDKLTQSVGQAPLIAKPGDVVVWGKSKVSPTGHTALVVSCNEHSVKVIEQDGSKPNAVVAMKTRRWDSQSLPFACLLRLAERYQRHNVEHELIVAGASTTATNPDKIPHIGGYMRVHPSMSTHIADATQRGVKIGGILALVHTALNADEFNIQGIELGLEKIGMHGWDVILLTALAVLLMVLYKVAVLNVKTGHKSRFYRAVVRIFGSARHAERQTNWIIKDLFNIPRYSTKAVSKTDDLT